jgi:hypothetical protein
LWKYRGKLCNLVDAKRKMIRTCRGREENLAVPCGRRKSCNLVEGQRKITQSFGWTGENLSVSWGKRGEL